MHALYPLKFEPILKEKVWGGKRMSSLLGKNIDHLSNCGESWEISGLTGNVSKVRNGFLAGNDLSELIEVYMGELLGEKVFDMHGHSFPLLFKFLDADDDLSIQVHPGQNMAMERHGQRGKEEIWYVVHAEPSAELIIGFQEDSSEETYLKHLQNNTLKDILRTYKVQAGDAFHIPAGQVHTIGKGLTICEIQQASDITYRIFDWNRPGTDGELRKLHTGEAAEVIEYKAGEHKINYPDTPNEPVELIKTPNFTTRLLSFYQNLELDYFFVDSFVVYMIVEGSCTISCPGFSDKLKTGDSLLIPAEINAIKLTPDHSCKLLETFISNQA
ncbi:MAG: mannose-6-phosphate isomerase [Bacteroidia bacterium]|nr:MAG: mannose-6-phosphate isomerase [Bacteroidia bacterium]